MPEFDKDRVLEGEVMPPRRESERNLKQSGEGSHIRLLNLIEGIAKERGLRRAYRVIEAERRATEAFDSLMLARRDLLLSMDAISPERLENDRQIERLKAKQRRAQTEYDTVKAEARLSRLQKELEIEDLELDVKREELEARLRELRGQKPTPEDQNKILERKIRAAVAREVEIREERERLMEAGQLSEAKEDAMDQELDRLASEIQAYRDKMEY